MEATRVSDSITLGGSPALAGKPPLATNGKLRECDWRFLLPTPPRGSFDHLVLPGADSETTRLLLEMGVADRVSRDSPPGQRADLIAIRADQGPPDDRLLATLRSDGLLYWEIDRRTRETLGCTPRRVGELLSRNGFTVDAVYWIKGNPRRPSMYLPLADATLGWYYRDLFGTRGSRRRLVRLAVRMLTGLQARRFATLIPVFAVVARRREAATLPPSVLSDNRMPAALRQPGARTAVLLTGEEDWSRVVSLPFEPGAARPAGVVKHPRIPAYNGTTESEHENLATARRALRSPARNSLPAPLELLHIRDLSVAIQDWSPGRSMLSGGGGRSPADDVLGSFGLAAEWLSDFHVRSTVERPEYDAGLETRLFADLLNTYTERFVATQPEHRLFRLCLDHSRRLYGEPFPVVWCHGDFGPWNVLRHEDRLAVIDWETARAGPALGDLLYLAMHWTWTTRGLGTERARRRELHRLILARAPHSPLGGTIRRHVACYAARLGIASGFLPLITLRTLVEQALDRSDRLRVMGSADANRREPNRYVGYVAALARDPTRLVQMRWW